MTGMELKKIAALTTPMIISNILSAAVSSVDVLMLNFVGQSAISAVSLATQISNITFSVLFGVSTGVVMLSAQYWGKRDLESIDKIQGIGLRIILAFTAILTAVCLIAPQFLMKIYTSDPELIEIGCRYLRIVGPSFLFWGVSEVYMSLLRSVGRVKASTGASVTALVSNVGLNAVFIFGLLGMPKMGVAGVALATSLSRFLQLVVCIVISCLSQNVKIRLQMVFIRSKVLSADFMKMAMPALANEILWGTAFSMYSVILGHLGSDAVAANSIVSVARQFGTAVAFSLAGASQIMVGQQLGEEKYEQAKRSGRQFLVLSAAAGGIGGILVLAVSPVIVQYASISAQAKDYLRFMMLINTYYCVGQAVNTTLIAGLFRAGGDSRFGMICDGIDMWCYAVPLGLFAAFVLKLPVKWVYFLICTDEFVKWPWVFKKYWSHSWIRNITRNKEELQQS